MRPSRSLISGALTAGSWCRSCPGRVAATNWWRTSSARCNERAVMSRVEDRLAELGLTMPGIAAPVAAYVPAVRSGDHVWTSGQLPFVDGSLVATGKVGVEVE